MNQTRTERRRFLRPALAAVFMVLCAAGSWAAGGRVLFISDFGLADDAVSQCKASILQAAPGASVVDMTHDIPPFDIGLAAFFLADSAPLWPAGTVFLAVVDPGVGTARRSIALETASGHYFVGPDNGLFDLAARKLGVRRIVSLENPKYFRSRVTTTFHGRDVFAPVAGRLAGDKSVFSDLGPRIQGLVPLDWRQPSLDGRALSGEILRVEPPWGNVWTNIDESLLARAGFTAGRTLTVSIGGRKLELPLAKTFGDVERGRPLAYVNSRGLLSFALNMGDFAKTYAAAAGEPLRIDLK